MTQPNLILRDTPAGSVARGGLASVIAWGLALVAQNNGIPVDGETLAAAGALVAGAISALIRLLPFAAR